MPGLLCAVALSLFPSCSPRFRVPPCLTSASFSHPNPRACAGKAHDTADSAETNGEPEFEATFQTWDNSVARRLRIREADPRQAHRERDAQVTFQLQRNESRVLASIVSGLRYSFSTSANACRRCTSLHDSFVPQRFCQRHRLIPLTACVSGILRAMHGHSKQARPSRRLLRGGRVDVNPCGIHANCRSGLWSRPSSRSKRPMEQAALGRAATPQRAQNSFRTVPHTLSVMRWCNVPLHGAAFRYMSKLRVVVIAALRRVLLLPLAMRRCGLVQL